MFLIFRLSDLSKYFFFFKLNLPNELFLVQKRKRLHDDSQDEVKQKKGTEHNDYA